MQKVGVQQPSFLALTIMAQDLFTGLPTKLFLIWSQVLAEMLLSTAPGPPPGAQPSLSFSAPSAASFGSN